MGLAKLSCSIAEREDPRAGELLSGMTSFFGRGVTLFLVNAAFIAICLLDVSFWGEHALKWWGELGSFVVTTLWVYVLLFWLIMQLYCAPFIVRENLGVGKALKKSALLVLDNLGYSTLLLVQVAVLVVFMGLFLVVPGQAKATFIGLSLMVLFFLFAAFVSLLGTEALDDLMRKYEQREKEAGEGEDNVANADRPEEESASA
jgi:small-conductance mechanosensitive channel